MRLHTFLLLYFLHWIQPTVRSKKTIIITAANPAEINNRQIRLILYNFITSSQLCIKSMPNVASVSKLVREECL